MEKLELEKIRVEKVSLNNSTQVRKLYRDSFPANERVAFKGLFSGVFEGFVLYGFYIEDRLIGFVHLVNLDEFVHINYLAVSGEVRSNGVGSYIINWVKNKFNDKTLVADVENLDKAAENNDQRYSRLKFYYKNGFRDGKIEFDWEGASMFYVHTNNIQDDVFMEHIIKCFPTITNLRPHKSNFLKVEQYTNGQKN